jgi:hypothetical protein
MGSKKGKYYQKKKKGAPKSDGRNTVVLPILYVNFHQIPKRKFGCRDKIRPSLKNKNLYLLYI